MGDKVLLVDDETDFLSVMSERLQTRGFDVETSDSAKNAVDQIEETDYDAVVLDLQMPGMDGIEVLKQIREKRPELQVILLTGHGSVEKGVEAIKLGAMDFLEKPADLEMISEKIKKAKQKRMLIMDKMTEKRIVDIVNRYGM